MAWANKQPDCGRGTIYSTAQACALLGVSDTTLRKYRALGLIASTPTGQYKGEAILELWRKHYNGII